MFDDIIQPKQKEESVKRIVRVDEPTWKQGCHTCRFSSKVLSNYKDKLLCVEKKRHVDPQFYCNKWAAPN